VSGKAPAIHPARPGTAWCEVSVLRGPAPLVATF